MSTRVDDAMACTLASPLNRCGSQPLDSSSAAAMSNPICDRTQSSAICERTQSSALGAQVEQYNSSGEAVCTSFDCGKAYLHSKLQQAQHDSPRLSLVALRRRTLDLWPLMARHLHRA